MLWAARDDKEQGGRITLSIEKPKKINGLWWVNHYDALRVDPCDAVILFGVGSTKRLVLGCGEGPATVDVYINC